MERASADKSTNTSADVSVGQSTEKPEQTPPGHEFLGSVEAPIIVDNVEIPEFIFTIQNIEITDSIMSNYPVYSVETTSTNTYGTTTTRVYIGYTISDVLDAAGITDNFITLQAIADDGYTVKVDYSVAMESTTLVAISENDKIFVTGLWFSPCSSNVSPDYLRELSVIRLID